LPNDPRGSWSDEIRVEPLRELGEIHYGRKVVQPSSAQVREFYEAAGDRLKHEPKTFTDEETLIVADGLSKVIEDEGYTCYGCAIMPDHVHMLIRRHRDKSEVMIDKLQARSRSAIIEAKCRGVLHPVWGGPGWKGFLNSRRDMERTVKYIRNNPVKIGKPVQEWAFAKRYDGWVPAYRG
jgi:REP element-mobilizing transposase RayT